MSTLDEKFEWWSAGVGDGIEAAMGCAQTALAVIAETYDSGDAERARMLISVYQGLLSLDRLGREADGRIGPIELFLDRKYLETIRRRAQEHASGEPDERQRD